MEEEFAVSYQDKAIPCRDCGGQFIFTAGEQEFYAGKGFVHEPTRCPAQRRARKQGITLPAGPCAHDVSGNGRVAAAEPRRAAPQDHAAGYAPNHGPERAPRREREPYAGPLPRGPVQARVLRIDPAGRYLFARVEAEGFDVYVHHSLFRDADVHEGDQVQLTVEDSARGFRALSLTST